MKKILAAFSRHLLWWVNKTSQNFLKIWIFYFLTLFGLTKNVAKNLTSFYYCVIYTKYLFFNFGDASGALILIASCIPFLFSKI